MIEYLRFAPFNIGHNFFLWETQDAITHRIKCAILSVVSFFDACKVMPVVPIRFNDKIINHKVANKTTNGNLIFVFNPKFIKEIVNYYFYRCWTRDIMSSTGSMTSHRTKTRSFNKTWFDFIGATAPLTSQSYFGFKKWMFYSVYRFLPYIHARIRAKSTAAIFEPRRDNFKFTSACFANTGYSISFLPSTGFDMSFIKTFFRTVFSSCAFRSYKNNATFLTSKFLSYFITFSPAFIRTKQFTISNVFFSALLTNFYHYFIVLNWSVPSGGRLLSRQRRPNGTHKITKTDLLLPPRRLDYITL
jgi:hypothetical protein